MKRLILPVVMVLAGLTPMSAAAQGKDLAGSWVLDVEKTGKKEGPPMIVLSFTETEFTAKLGGETAKPTTFKLERPDSASGQVMTAVWDGKKLTARIMGPGGPETPLLYRDGEWLVMEGKTEQGPMRLYFKKAPVK